MNIIVLLSMLLGLLFAIWTFWSILEIIYRVVMILLYLIAYIAITLWEVFVWVARWTIVKPLCWVVTGKNN